MKKILELLGIGLLLNIPLLLILVLVFWIVVPLDRAVSPVVDFLFRIHIPFLGFATVALYLMLSGSFVRSRIGGKILQSVTSRSRILKLFFTAARSQTLHRLLKSRSGFAPNIVMAPFFRPGSEWPFMISRIVPTTDIRRPKIVGVFFDIPIWRPMTLSVDDEVIVNLSFDEALAFATSSGVLPESFERPLRYVRLGDYIQEPEFIAFFANGESVKKKHKFRFGKQKP